MSSYVVTCCARPVALLVDDRPDGRLSVEADSTAIILAGQITIGGVEPYKMAQEQVASNWTEHAVTQTLWPDGHMSWTIRCSACRDHAQDRQAQMSDKSYVRIADRLSRNQQPVIPLDVLCSMVKHING
jgi:hypothetical protein